jgi:hypothetical protein
MVSAVQTTLQGRALCKLAWICKKTVCGSACWSVPTDCHNNAVFSGVFSGEICAVAFVVCLRVSNIRRFSLVERVQGNCDMREGCVRAKSHHLPYWLTVQPSQRCLAPTIPLKYQTLILFKCLQLSPYTDVIQFADFCSLTFEGFLEQLLCIKQVLRGGGNLIICGSIHFAY